MQTIKINEYFRKLKSQKSFFLLFIFLLLISVQSFAHEQIKVKRVMCAGGIIFHPLHPEKWVIVMGKQGAWSLPKGHVEKGETYLEAAKREVYEETGLTDLVFERELGTYERIKLKKNRTEDFLEIKVVNIFLFRTQSTNLCPIDPDNPVAKWVDTQECLQLLKHESDREFILQNVLPLINSSSDLLNRTSRQNL